MLDDAFRENFAASAKVTASEFRGEDQQYAPGNIVDGDGDTYWATNDETSRAHVEIDLGSPRNVKYIVLQEYIRLGQRVKSFNVEYWENGAWKPLASGSTIGYKRILKVSPVNTGKVRINITESKACPVISNVGIY